MNGFNRLQEILCNSRSLICVVSFAITVLAPVYQAVFDGLAGNKNISGLNISV